MTATYSPDDNKLRLYSDSRLDPETYQRVRKAGFIWAPKQKLFVAGMWTPYREDLLIELCGEIEDEDKSLVERAEERAERFENYSDNREKEANQSYDAVTSIANNIPLGQPILIGHHSEKRARKMAEKIQNGMSKAVRLWDQSKYWTSRAAGALAHAKYKELPRTRARRIKTLEADLRKQQRNKKEAETYKDQWSKPNLTLAGAIAIANYDWITYKTADHDTTLYQALTQGIIDEKKATEIAIRVHDRSIAWADRWINHLNNRLAYEKAMLEEQGALSLIKKKPRPKQLPLLNYDVPEGIDIENQYHKGEYIHYKQIRMTKDEYSKAYDSRKGTATVEHTHRVRVYITMHKWAYVFITDSKVHKRPGPGDLPEEKKPEPRQVSSYEHKPKERTKFDDLKDSLQKGVKSISAPSLFETPPDLALRMASELDIKDGQDILEPSAGTGHLIDAVLSWGKNISIHAIEKNWELYKLLSDRYQSERSIVTFNSDFMTFQDAGGYDRIIMNPPFEDKQDIDHILHAYQLLKSGGKIVAIMSEGSFYRSDLKSTAFRNGLEVFGTSEKLPQDTFKSSGTRVNTRLVIIRKP